MYLKLGSPVRLDPTKATVNPLLYSTFGDCQYNTGRVERIDGRYSEVKWPGISFPLTVHFECLKVVGG